MAHTDSTTRQRPTSPHLGIYRWTITMASSIIHRLTGVALGVGTLLLTWWLLAAATGPDQFYMVQNFIYGWFGRFIIWNNSGDSSGDFRSNSLKFHPVLFSQVPRPAMGFQTDQEGSTEGSL